MVSSNMFGRAPRHCSRVCGSLSEAIYRAKGLWKTGFSSTPVPSIAVLSGLGQFNEITIPRRMIERSVANSTASDCTVKFHCIILIEYRLRLKIE
mgnify:CR=1 FL=1|jgi:hypothetical protein